MLLAVASAVFLGSESLGTRDHILLTQISLFVASYDSQGHGGGIRSRLHTGSWCNFSLFSPISDECKNLILLRRNPHWWSPIISSVYGLNIDRRILNEILYGVHNRHMSRELTIVLSPLWTGTIIDFFHWSGNSSLFQIEWMILWISERNVSPPAWIIFAGVSSVPGDLYFFQLCSSNFGLKMTWLWY
jgi:hypothetical protein